MLLIIVLIIFFVLGWRGTWRRVIIISLFSYAALIIAAQHNATISGTGLMQSVVGESEALRRSALAFVISLVIVFIGLHVLFTIVWGEDSQSTSEESGLVRAAKGIVTGIVGWVLGAMLLSSIIVFLTEGSSSSSPEEPEISSSTNIIRETSEIAIKLVEPWVPSSRSVQVFDVLGEDFVLESFAPLEQIRILPTSEPTDIPPDPTATTPSQEEENLFPAQRETYTVAIIYPESGAYISRGEAEQKFSWNLDGQLAENHSFEIRFYKVDGTEPVQNFGWVKENSQLINLNLLNSGGDYEWNIVIVQGTDGVWEEDVYKSPHRTLKWEG